MTDPDAGTRRTRRDPRRERTRQRLLAAAREVFERDGFYNAKLADITAAAGVSTGTLYNYYTSKEEIFRDVVVEVEKDLTTVAPADELEAYRSPVTRLRAANRAYVRGYRRNAALIRLLPQMRDSDDEIRALGRSIIEHFQNRVAAAIERWQREDLVYPDLDATYTAHALTFMTERLVVVATTRMYEFDYDEGRLLDTINKVWERTLGFDRLAD